MLTRTGFGNLLTVKIPSRLGYEQDNVLPFDDPDGIQLELTTPAVPGPVTGA
jgi:hypothetical protein